MKRLLALSMVLALIFPAGLSVSRGDILPPRPYIPQREQEPADADEGTTVYASAGSIVVACMVCSLGALYFIRKRNGH